MTRIALDLYCGAGLAAVGLWRSGQFDKIVGVDIEPQPDYPFDFIQTDALEYDWKELNPDFIWTSPPCQSFTSLKNLTTEVLPDGKEIWEEKHKDLIEPTRQLIADHEWTCIENVRFAPIRADIVLEGGNVGIPHLKRHRIFEVSWEPQLQVKPFQIGKVLITPYGMGAPASKKIRQRRIDMGLPSATSVVEMQHAYQTEHTSNRKSLCEGIPPKYAQYVIYDARQRGFGDGKEE